MKLRVKLDEGAYLPDRSYPTDGGADLFAPGDIYVRPWGSATVDTGVHVEVPHGYAGLLVSKSGLNVNKGVISTGLVDCGYDGSVRVKLYNMTNHGVTLKKGAKISQLVLVKVDCADIVQVDEIAAGPRGDNGFGSTSTIESEE